MNNKLVKDALFGAIGGVAGTFVIRKAMGVLSRFQSSHDKWIERELVREQPTEALAGKVAESAGVRLTKDQKMRLGQVVYWGYGTLWGAIYGILRHRVPASSKAGGLPFGVAFGLIGPAVLLPAFDLTPPATEFPASSHARGLASHYAYAATVEGVCTALEAAEQAANKRKSRLTKTELRRVS